MIDRIPLTEFDHDKSAVIQPAGPVTGIALPEHCVMPIYGSLIKKLKDEGRLEKLDEVEKASVTPIRVYRLDYGGSTIVVANPGLGSPLVVGTFEELVAFGCRKFVACGSAGVLKSELVRNTIIIPGSAVRDEGTSYHYCPPSRFIEMDDEVVKKLEAVLIKHGMKYEVGKTWTTDAFYRETRGKVAKRRAEGCLTVEMECSALMAVARFRNVVFGQYLLAEDDVSGDKWDRRHVDDNLPIQEKIFWLSVEACLSL